MGTYTLIISIVAYLQGQLDLSCTGAAVHILRSQEAKRPTQKKRSEFCSKHPTSTRKNMFHS
jgi:hypothetical protein